MRDIKQQPKTFPANPLHPVILYKNPFLPRFQLLECQQFIPNPFYIKFHECQKLIPEPSDTNESFHQKKRLTSIMHCLLFSFYMIIQLLTTWPGTIDRNHYNTIPFKKVDEPNGWLGNMSRHPLMVPSVPGGVQYQTAEHYYQCMKFDDPQIQQEILAKNSPMSAKWVAKGKARDVPEKRAITSYTPADLDLMRQTIRLKLENHPNLRAQLLALPEDGIIIEDASARGGASARFWGMKLENGIWTGQNWLGRLWMELRLELTKTPADTTSN